MSDAKFTPYDLKIVQPSFESPLIDLIIELDYLRKKQLYGSIHPNDRLFNFLLREYQFKGVNALLTVCSGLYIFCN